MTTVIGPSHEIDSKGRKVREQLTFLLSHGEFRKADLDARPVLNLRLAERIWSPERLDEEAAS